MYCIYGEVCTVYYSSTCSFAIVPIQAPTLLCCTKRSILTFGTVLIDACNVAKTRTLARTQSILHGYEVRYAHKLSSVREKHGYLESRYYYWSCTGARKHEYLEGHRLRSRCHVEMCPHTPLEMDKTMFFS